MNLIGQTMVYVSRIHALQLSSRQRCITWTGAFTLHFMVCHLTNKNSTSCTICFWLICVSQYCVICLFKDMLTPRLCKLSMICIQRISFCYIEANNSTVLSKNHNIKFLWPFCLFWQVNSLKQTIYILRNTSCFTKVDLILIFKSKITIIAIQNN